MLMMALAPVFGALLAWVFLGETLELGEIIGIGITLFGIMIVIAERSGNGQVELTDRRRYRIGLLCGLGGALGQAGGLVLSRIGMGMDYPPLSANLIRLLIAVIVVWGFAAVNRQVGSSYRTLRANPRALALLTGGAILGPVLGVWLTLVAVQNTSIGVALTLASLMPIFLIPISYAVFGERITRRAVGGTLITFVGTVILFL
jgi:drug/metabolite transporter (DMT)-like permease